MNRIQRKRTKGWKMPKNTVYVGRPSKWGNPIKLEGDCIFIDASYRRRILSPWVYYSMGDEEDVIYLFEKLFDGTEFYNQDFQYWSDHFRKLNISKLSGKDLACWCSLDKPCHADVLIKYASNEIHQPDN